MAALLAYNIRELPLAQAAHATLAVTVAALVLFLLLHLLLRDWHRAAALSTLTVLLLLSYAHLYAFLEQHPIAGVPIGRHRYLLRLITAILVLATWHLGLRHSTDVRRLTPALNLTALVLLIVPLFSLGAYLFKAVRQPEPELAVFQFGRPRLQPPEGGVLPDVCYILLDGYARSDMMQQYFGYDNSDFIAFLEFNGFYVAGAAHANHNWTALFLASSLNMSYAQDLGLELTPGRYPSPFVGPIRNSLVRAQYERLGYKTVALDFGYVPTQILDDDLYLSPQAESLPILQGTWPVERL